MSAWTRDSSTGKGYNLIFQGTNQVQFLDDGDAWGNSYTFNWQLGTWYWFQLEENNGTLQGKVWAAGTAEPQSWMFQQTGWTDLTGGAPCFDGGSGRLHRLIRQSFRDDEQHPTGHGQCGVRDRDGYRGAGHF